MPSVTYSPVPHYEPPPPPAEKLDYADLPIIDISKAQTAEGRMDLAKEVQVAMSTQGFFYVVGHGYSEAQTMRIFDIANVSFDQVSDEEKTQYQGKVKETGSYQGYKPRQYWHIKGGVRDQIDQYNIHRDGTKRAHPEALRPFMPEIGAFARHNHFNIVHPILRLLALGLELPEETLVDKHGYDADGETWVRFMKYYPRSKEEEEKAENVWLKGHTDFGSITVLWSQPVAALQILGQDGKWRWVRHIENALVINAGDTVEALSGGFYKATIHRVVQPPPSQRGYPRLGAFYFAQTDDDVKLVPYESQSPVLQRVGVVRKTADEDAPTMGQWRKGRASAYGQTDLKPGQKKGVEEEYINGVLVKHYN